MKAMKILEKQCFEISCNHWLFLQWMMIRYMRWIRIIHVLQLI